MSTRLITKSNPLVTYTFPRFDADSVPLPLTPKALYGYDCDVMEIDISNTADVALTATISNAAGDPPWVVCSILPGNMMSYRSHAGKLQTGGLMWSASGRGLVGSVCIRLNI